MLKLTKMFIAVLFLTAILSASLVAANVPTQKDISKYEKSKECSPRGGLPNFFAKLKAGKNVNIGYFGGSITAQAGWRVQTLDYFQKLYPKAKLKEIHAAIGGTNSMLGVYRMEYDLLKHKPDLVFVEFAVNDANTNPVTLFKTFEGIISKIWKQDPHCDICFVYTFTESLSKDLVKGKFPRATATMELIAEHYGIPTIHMGIEAIELFKKGKLEIKSKDTVMTAVAGDELNKNAKVRLTKDGKIPFSGDGVHPYTDTGHKLYTEAIIRSMPAIQAAATEPKAHTLPQPIDPENLSSTLMLSVDEAKLEGPWKKLSLAEINKVRGGISNRVPVLMRGEPGASLSFKFKGSQAMMYHLIGPSCGQIKIELDGKSRLSKNFDRYCTWHRLATVYIGSNLDPNKIHEVKITVVDDKFDKREILFEKNRKDFDKNPDKYKDAFWYVGAIFINGEFIN